MSPGADRFQEFKPLTFAPASTQLAASLQAKITSEVVYGPTKHSKTRALLGENELEARNLRNLGSLGGAASAGDQNCVERARTRDLKLGLSFVIFLKSVRALYS